MQCQAKCERDIDNSYATYVCNTCRSPQNSFSESSGDNIENAREKRSNIDFRCFLMQHQTNCQRDIDNSYAAFNWSPQNSFLTISKKPYSLFLRKDFRRSSRNQFQHGFLVFFYTLLRKVAVFKVWAVDFTHVTLVILESHSLEKHCSSSNETVYFNLHVLQPANSARLVALKECDSSFV